MASTSTKKKAAPATRATISEFERVARAVEKLEQNSAGDWEFVYHVGRLLVEFGFTDQGNELLHQSLELHETPMAHALLADTLFEDGEIDHAIEHLLDASRLAPQIFRPEEVQKVIDEHHGRQREQVTELLPLCIKAHERLSKLPREKLQQVMMELTRIWSDDYNTAFEEDFYIPTLRVTVAHKEFPVYLHTSARLMFPDINLPISNEVRLAYDLAIEMDSGEKGTIH
jgi:hypothetical protein